MNSNVDIIIPIKNACFDKKHSIYFTVKSLLFQKGIRFNIYLVDDKSSDETISYLKKTFSEYDNITILKNDNEGVASARNYGVRKGNAEYLLFIDGDTILSSDRTIENTLNVGSDYSFACGAIRYWTPINWEEYVFKHDTYRSWLNILKRISYLPKGVDRNTGFMDVTHVSFIGNYGLIKRSIFEKIGGFPITYKGWGLEDTHLMYLLCLNNYDYYLLKDDNIMVYHLNHKQYGKEKSFIKNLTHFQEFQNKVGITFCESAFFDEFDGIMPVLKQTII